MNTSSPKPARDEVGLVLAVMEMVSGVAAAVYAYVHGGTHRLVSEPGFRGVGGELRLATLVVALAFLIMSYAGWRLWRGTKLGYRLSALVFGMQIVQVVAQGFQYKLMCPVALLIGWNFNGTGLWMGAEYGVSFAVGVGAAEVAPYLRVNICALAACTYLLLWRWYARARL
jgi:hypothetical protein